ncbi:MAG: uroporphyrinogen-III C-methyltransferase [Pseudomonadales bacterium]|nr:uroporphyrinogen-III C-methyltransferase [Pseudomonadales bacterium]
MLALLALLIALGAGGIAGWPYWLAYQGQDPLAGIEARVGRMESRLDTRTEELEAVSERAQRAADALRSEMEAREASFAELRGAFASLSSEVAGTGPVDEPRWRLAEVHYLLRIANQRARMEQDADGALALLSAADDVLAELDDYGLYPVREAIAAALSRLRMQPVVDRVGIYLELEQLSARIAELPAGRREFPPPAPPSLPDSDADAATWARTLAQRFAGLFDFRIHRPAPVLPLVAPSEINLLRHNLRLKLEQAQLALLRGDQAVWQDALGDAATWVETYFDPDAPGTRSLREALLGLAAVRVDVEIPDISEPAIVLERLRGRLTAEGAAS